LTEERRSADGMLGKGLRLLVALGDIILRVPVLANWRGMSRSPSARRTGC
jgi:hypothetical protein